MRLKDVKDINKFFSLIDKHDGCVELVTEQGDYMKLGCKLSQFVIMEKMAKDDDFCEGKIIFNKS